MNSIKKILLINFGGIGDEILFLPVIKSVKEKYPESEITLCLEPRSKSIKDLSCNIDKLLLVDIKSKNKYLELLKLCLKVRFCNYDTVISSGANKMIPLLLFFMGIKNRIGYDSGGITKNLLTQAVKLNKNQYAGRMYHDLVNEFTKCEYEDPSINAEKSTKTAEMIVIHPGVSKMSIEKNIIKSYGNERWAELTELLLNKGEKVALVGGPDDEECIYEILRILNEKNCNCENLHNFYGQTKNLNELASLMAGSKVVVCCDSAPMHLAIALGVKTIAIFGPTDEKKLVPKRNNVVVIKADCDCRPCLWDRRMTSCKDKICLNISNQQILQQI